MLVLDSGGLSRLSHRTGRSLALISQLRAVDLWPPIVPTVVLVEALTGQPSRDANEHRFLKTCRVEQTVTTSIARRAAHLRRVARRGSAVDALVVALAEPGGTVLTGNRADLEALAAHAERVTIEVV